MRLLDPNNPDDMKKLLEIDTSIFEVNEQTRQDSMKYGVRGDVRLSMGYVWLDKEFEKYRQEVLSTPLP